MNLPVDTTPLQYAFKRLALIATGLLALSLALSFFEPLFRITATPLLMTNGFFWLAYLCLAGFSDDPYRHSLFSVQGPGDEVLQYAGTKSYKRELAALEPPAEKEKINTKNSNNNSLAEFVAATAAWKKGAFAKTITHCRAALETQPTLAAQLNLGAALLNGGQLPEAHQELRLGLQRAQHQQDGQFEAAFLANLAVVHLRQGDLAPAQTMADQAQGLFRQNGDNRGWADALLCAGSAATQQGLWQDAENLITQAHDFYQQLHHSLGRANAQSHLGTLHLRQGHTETALSFYQGALRRHRFLGNRLGQAAVLTHLGNLHFRGNQIDKALKTYQRARGLHQKLEAPLGEAGVLGNIGNIYFKRGKFDDALSLYKRALEIHRQVGNVLGSARTLANIGALHIRQKAYDPALRALEEARHAFVKSGAKGKGPEAVEENIRRLKRRQAKKTKG